MKKGEKKMKKKYNKRIFAFSFALIIVGMLTVNASAHLTVNNSKDESLDIISPPVEPGADSPIFIIPNDGTYQMHVSNLFPNANYLDMPELVNLKLLSFNDIYFLRPQYSDGYGEYYYIWEGYYGIDDPYSLVVRDYSYNAETGMVQLYFGIIRGDGTYLYTGATGEWSYTYYCAPIMFYTPEEVPGVGEPTVNNNNDLAKIILSVYPMTTSYRYQELGGDYSMGYNDGMADAKEQNLQLGYNEGRAQGYAIGYTEGYNANENSNPFKNLINAVIFTPINTVMSMLNFELFGINMKGMVLTLLTTLIVIAIVVILWKKVT